MKLEIELDLIKMRDSLWVSECYYQDSLWVSEVNYQETVRHMIKEEIESLVLIH